MSSKRAVMNARNSSPNPHFETSSSATTSQPLPVRARTGPLVFAQQTSQSNPSVQQGSSRTPQTLPPAGQQVGERANSSDATSSKSGKSGSLFNNLPSSTPGSATVFGGTNNKTAPNNFTTNALFRPPANLAGSVKGDESPSVSSRRLEKAGFGQSMFSGFGQPSEKPTPGSFGQGMFGSTGFGAHASSLTPKSEDKRSKSASPSPFKPSPNPERSK
ncbi:MAG: hypothetical protein Q9160_003096 [Pyrenula sp. 1 TL-2023]